MIHRLLSVIGVATIVVGGLVLLSNVWQFGYVGSGRSLGLRAGKLWYVWRVVPISDGEGFYVDSASEYNRAMYGIANGARFWDKTVGPPRWAYSPRSPTPWFSRRSFVSGNAKRRDGSSPPS